MSTGITWFLIGAILVFFMQCGFAMVESGFTRAKNTGNILMKNFADFCIGTICFVLLGFGLLCGIDTAAGFVGLPNMDIFGCFTTLFDGIKIATASAAEIAAYDEAVSTAVNFVFNLMFCATAATIVSGAMAERTRFVSYCVYSAVISLVVYPIEAHWLWGGGWLSDLFGMGFVDYAGSTLIHMVGGCAALIGIIFLGARIGKFERDENGKVIKVNAIQGHDLTVGALGVLILWFGWYGFNGAAAIVNDSTYSFAAGGDVGEYIIESFVDGGALARIFVTTTLAPVAATLVAMFTTWIRNKKPDVVMTMNGSLAGLVAITAGCEEVDAVGALVIGIVAGFIVVFGTDLLEKVLHVDDCVGAVPVHFMNGIWGTLAVGFFSRRNGLFYTGDGLLLGTQAVGIISVLAWAAICMVITFAAIKFIPVMIKYKTVKPAEVLAYAKTWNGLRANPEEEIIGLDLMEHGLSSAYPDFVPSVPSYDGEGEDVDISGVTPAAIDLAPANTGKYTKITIITGKDKFLTLKDAMAKIGVTGMTVSNVMGCGTQAGKTGQYRGVKTTMHLIPKVQVEIVVSTVDPKLVVAVAQKVCDDGKYGAGKIFVSGIENVMRVRTGETGVDALTNDPEPSPTK